MRIFVLLVVMMIATSATALEPGPDDAYVRVVDVGSGLCTVTAIAGEHYMLFDAGHWTGDHCIKAVREIVGDKVIDLMVISHSDSDHLGEANEILSEFEVTMDATNDLLVARPRHTA